MFLNVLVFEERRRLDNGEIGGELDIW